MAELSQDETFFQGVINESKVNLKHFEQNQLEHIISDKIEKENCVIVPKEIKKTFSDSQKENVKEAKTKKPEKVPRKSTRQPLKSLNAITNHPGGGKVSKRSGNSLGQENVFLPNDVAIKNENIPTKTIIIFEDPLSEGPKDTGKGKNQETLAKPKAKTSGGRKTLNEVKIKSDSPRTRGGRYSLNDVPSRKSVNEKKKLSPLTKNAEKKPARARSSPKPSPTPAEREEAIAKLENIFPDVDPDYLRTQCLKLKGSLHETIALVLTKDKTGELPTRADHSKRLEIERVQKKYKENFSVESYLKMISDPWQYFLTLNRHKCARYADHSFHYLKNKFKKHYVRAIQEVLIRNGFSLYLANKELQKKNRTLKMRATNRSKLECDAGKPLTFDIQFMHEVAFIENETKLKAAIRKMENSQNKKLKEAEVAGTLLECQSCDCSLLVENAVICPASHAFCKNCVIRCIHIEIGRENFYFKCLKTCEGKFLVEYLQEVLSPAVVATIIERIQEEKFRLSRVSDLACCPFCHSVSVLCPEATVLLCPNPGCMMESCRYCKQMNHRPLQCEKVEGMDPDKTPLESNTMNTTLACFHCKKDFVHGDDCNRMICPCGATICSVCRQPFPDCPHFYAQLKVEDRRSSTGSDAADSVGEETEFLEKQMLDYSIPPLFDPTEAAAEFFSSESIFF